jgi:hypothetical protein
MVEVEAAAGAEAVATALRSPFVAAGAAAVNRRSNRSYRHRRFLLQRR